MPALLTARLVRSACSPRSVAAAASIGIHRCRASSVPGSAAWLGLVVALAGSPVARAQEVSGDAGAVCAPRARATATSEDAGVDGQEAGASGASGTESPGVTAGERESSCAALHPAISRKIRKAPRNTIRKDLSLQLFFDTRDVAIGAHVRNRMRLIQRIVEDEGFSIHRRRWAGDPAIDLNGTSGSLELTSEDLGGIEIAVLEGPGLAGKVEAQVPQKLRKFIEESHEVSQGFARMELTFEPTFVLSGSLEHVFEDDWKTLQSTGLFYKPCCPSCPQDLVDEHGERVVFFTVGLSTPLRSEAPPPPSLQEILSDVASLHVGPVSVSTEGVELNPGLSIGVGEVSVGAGTSVELVRFSRQEVPDTPRGGIVAEVGYDVASLRDGEREGEPEHYRFRSAIGLREGENRVDSTRLVEDPMTSVPGSVSGGHAPKKGTATHPEEFEPFHPPSEVEDVVFYEYGIDRGRFEETTALVNRLAYVAVDVHIALSLGHLGGVLQRTSLDFNLWPEGERVCARHDCRCPKEQGLAPGTRGVQGAEAPTPWRIVAPSRVPREAWSFGSVLDAEGSPVADAWIYLDERLLVTDEAGRFYIPGDLAAGGHELALAEPVGGAEAQRAELQVEAGGGEAPAGGQDVGLTVPRYVWRDFRMRGSQLTCEPGHERGVRFGEHPARILYCVGDSAWQVRPPPPRDEAGRSTLGDHELIATVDGVESEPVDVQRIGLQMELRPRTIKAGRQGWVVLRAVGTPDPLTLRITNRSPEIVRLSGGREVAVRTSGGEDNRVRLRYRGQQPGDFLLDVQIVEGPR